MEKVINEFVKKSQEILELNWNPRFQFAKVNSVLLEYSQE